MLTCFEDEYFCDGKYIVKKDLKPFQPFQCKSCGHVFKIGEPAKQILIMDFEDLTCAYCRLCEHCDEILMTLEGAGYCAYGEVLEGSATAQSLLEEYWALTGFDPKKYKVK